MNKQELIEKIEASKYSEFIYDFDGWKEEKKFNSGLDCALSYVNQLDEPEKPVVPQFVADWYEENKDDLEYNLYKLCTDFREQKLRVDLNGWFGNDDNKPIETLVKMKLYGYEVEKEKLYTVEIPNPNNKYSKTYLCRDRFGEVELFNWSGYSSIKFADNWKQEENAQLTESEIKEDFYWAWQFAEEVKND